MASRLPGYTRLAGSERAYVTPEGERISYRAYRRRVEEAGAVQRLSPVDLANARRRQRDFNDIINQMAKVKRNALVTQIENARARGATLETAALQTQYRRAKAEAKKSPMRKEALETLKTYHHKKDAASQEKQKQALKILGRREGVPDWVPVGMSSRKRGGKFRKSDFRVAA